MKKQTITIVIADDHDVVCRGLMALFSTELDFQVAGCASNGREAVDLCAKYRPHIALVDLIMPIMGGVEATKQILLCSPSTAVIALTSVETEHAVRGAIQAGAISYLLKDTQPEELVKAIRQTASGDTIFSPRVAAIMAKKMANEMVHQPLHSLLSTREMEVLKLIAEGLSNKELADRLRIGEKTIKTHVSNILGKLGIADRTQAAIYAWKNGIAN